MATVRALQGDTVDLICWRHYGRTADVTEAVYQANPGLADLGTIIPQGHEIYLPAPETTAPATQTISLWR